MPARDEATAAAAPEVVHDSQGKSSNRKAKEQAMEKMNHHVMLEELER